MTKEACENLGREIFRKLAADPNMWQQLNQSAANNLGGMVPGRAATYGGAGALAGMAGGGLLTALLKKDPKAKDYLLNALIGGGLGAAGGAGLGYQQATEDYSDINKHLGEAVAPLVQADNNLATATLNRRANPVGQFLTGPSIEALQTISKNEAEAYNKKAPGLIAERHGSYMTDKDAESLPSWKMMTNSAMGYNNAARGTDESNPYDR